MKGPIGGQVAGHVFIGPRLASYLDADVWGQNNHLLASRDQQNQMRVEELQEWE